MNDPVVNEPVDSVAVADGAQQFRSQVGHISRHSGVFFAGTLFSVALSYAFKVYMARVLGAEVMGAFALGLTLVGLMGTFNNLGLVTSALRFPAVYSADHNWTALSALLWRGGAILLASNIFLAIIFWRVGGVVAVRFYHSPLLARYIPWFAILMLLGVFSTFYEKILAGYKRVGRRTLITNFVGSPVMMLLAVLLTHLGWGFRGYLLAQVIGASLVVTLLLSMVWRFTPAQARLSFRWPPPLERELWSFSQAAMGLVLLQFLISQTDKITLGFYRGARDVGIYSVSASVVAYVSLILNSVNLVFSPMIADLHTRKDFAMLGRLYRALTKWIVGLTLPLAITVMVFADPIMRIFGHDFETGWPVLIIGTAGQLVNCGVGSVGMLLLMSGHQQRLLRVQMMMAAVMTLACVALIPVWGVIGAAIAAAITNAGTNILNLLQVRKTLGLTPFNHSYLRLILPAAVTTLIAVGLKSEAGLFRQAWIAIAVSMTASYLIFAAMVAMLGLDADDRLVATALWSRVRKFVPAVEGWGL